MIKIIYSNGDIYVMLSGKISFGTYFLSNIAKLFTILKNFKYDKICFKWQESSEIDKLSLAYIYNICSYLKHNMKIKILMSKNFYFRLMGSVSNISGKDYTMQEFSQEIVANDIKHYVLHGETEFNAVVEDLTNLIIDKNIIIDKDNVQSFLKTTIGEVFSNACNHNNINEYYYFKDTIFEDDKFYLIVNVLDYGNTIAKNVNTYFHNRNEEYQGYCIDWAIKEGNTTREGSGGYGLPTLLDYVKKVEGDLTILSSNELFFLREGKYYSYCKADGKFPGTAICFKIKLYDLDKFLIFDRENNTLSTRRISLNDI